MSIFFNDKLYSFVVSKIVVFIIKNNYLKKSTNNFTNRLKLKADSKKKLRDRQTIKKNKNHKNWTKSC